MPPSLGSTRRGPGWRSGACSLSWPCLSHTEIGHKTVSGPGLPAPMQGSLGWMPSSLSLCSQRPGQITGARLAHRAECSRQAGVLGEQAEARTPRPLAHRAGFLGVGIQVHPPPGPVSVPLPSSLGTWTREEKAWEATAGASARGALMPPTEASRGPQDPQTSSVSLFHLST